MSLTHVLFLLLLLFVLILKAWHWQINNLSLGFQMSQQSLSSHADVSVGSDVCNSIGAQRERNAGLWPLAGLCILSSLVRRDAKLQSLNAARPRGHLSTVAAVLGVHPRDTTQSSHKICDLTVLEIVFFRDLSYFFSACLSVCLSFMVERTCLWLSCRPQTLLPALIPSRHNPLKLSLSLSLLVTRVFVLQDNSGAALILTKRHPPLPHS